MYDEVVAVVLCILAAAVIGLFILPIIALSRTRRIDEIFRRLMLIERELKELRSNEVFARADVVEKFEQPAPAATVAEPIVAQAPTPTIEPRVIVERLPRKRLPVEKISAADWSAIDWEAWLGARGLGWAAVVLLLFATAFFFRELFERNLIGPLGRVGIGLAIGCLACFAGYRQHRKGWPLTCQMLTAAGVLLVYLSTFASFGYYKLLDVNHAGIFLVIAVVEAFALALAYNAPAIAIMAVVGGLLNPVLLHTGQDRYVGLFTYLLVLNAAVAGVLILRRWRALGLLVVIGSNVLFWMWYFDNYHPSKLTAVLVFQGALTALWLGQQILGPMTRYARLDPEEAVRLFVQALLLTVAGYELLNVRFHEWMGTIALGAAIVHAAMTWLVLRRRPDDPIHAMCEWTLAMGFLAAAMPLQASAPWVPVLWAAQGLALWWFSLKIRNFPLRGMAFIFFVLAFGRFVVRQAVEGHHNREPFTPLLNAFALSGLSVAAAYIVAAVLGRRQRPHPDSNDFLIARIVGFAGMFLVWVVVSMEAYDYFNAQRMMAQTAIQAQVAFDGNRENFHQFLAERDLRLARSGQVALSIVWGLYACVLLALGLRLPSRPLRWSALALFGITLLKVLVLDMQELPGLYRVAALLGLALMMGAAAWGYQKVKVSILTAKEGDDDAHPI